jgi:hypothetical protein
MLKVIFVYFTAFLINAVPVYISILLSCVINVVNVWTILNTDVEKILDE